MKQRWISLAAVLTVALLLIGCETLAPGPTLAPGQPDSVRQAEVTIKPIATDGARNLANTCFGCHGPNGRSPGTIPSLTTLSASDISTRLTRFRNGEVSSTVMGRQAKGYSDAEIEAIANYIAEPKK